MFAEVKHRLHINIHIFKQMSCNIVLVKRGFEPRFHVLSSGCVNVIHGHLIRWFLIKGCTLMPFHFFFYFLSNSIIFLNLKTAKKLHAILSEKPCYDGTVLLSDYCEMQIRAETRGVCNWQGRATNYLAKW